MPLWLVVAGYAALALVISVLANILLYSALNREAIKRQDYQRELNALNQQARTLRNTIMVWKIPALDLSRPFSDFSVYAKVNSKFKEAEALGIPGRAD